MGSNKGMEMKLKEKLRGAVGNNKRDLGSYQEVKYTVGEGRLQEQILWSG